MHVLGSCCSANIMRACCAWTCHSACLSSGDTYDVLRLPRVLGVQLVQALAQPVDLLRMYPDVAGLALLAWVSIHALITPIPSLCTLSLPTLPGSKQRAQPASSMQDALTHATQRHQTHCKPACSARVVSGWPCLEAARGLVQHDARVGQRAPLPCLAGSQQQ